MHCREEALMDLIPVSLAAIAMLGAVVAASAQSASVLAAEMIFDKAPFAQCHASAIAQTPAGQLIAAWFGGTAESKPDVGIWISRRIDGRWSTPVEVADGIQPAGSQTPRYPCWNPVLFQPKSGPLMLFYKVGPSPDRWWGMVITSNDGGATWSAPSRLPDGIYGPIKNKPVQLPSGEILCPSSTEDRGWRVHIESSADGGRTWRSTGPIVNGTIRGAIQPSILTHRDGRLQILCRTGPDQVIAQSWSSDAGRSWSALEPTTLPNPNSGTDAVTLADGRHLLVYNPTKTERTPLVLAISDDGKSWKDILVLEDRPGEYSYPAIIQGADGIVHITYTHRRQTIRYVAVRVP